MRVKNSKSTRLLWAIYINNKKISTKELHELTEVPTRHINSKLYWDMGQGTVKREKINGMWHYYVSPNYKKYLKNLFERMGYTNERTMDSF